RMARVAELRRRIVQQSRGGWRVADDTTPRRRARSVAARSGRDRLPHSLIAESAGKRAPGSVRSRAFSSELQNPQHLSHISQLRNFVRRTMCPRRTPQRVQCRGNTMHSFANAFFSAVAAMSLSGVLFSAVLI